ncbi:formyltetrahydrofolate deformylase [Brevibacterium sanguinis]|uniref:Formyltetrahydrofolate deformylase n=2 Tax=Brevibacterium TaxID=1696 RepID=A0A366IEY9_9MICO|nr:MULTISPECIES: formyltetrahydrofolate deformylase [Brevibacterium]RBP62411.1 formyltetrahydrofolate deformylase [Brevibacterium sanguinis]RBP68800.1 formyltetrahydrofolate deformylase [Brevibacterium celere]
MSREWILRISCPDATGIVHAVTGVLADLDANITESQQFSSPDSRQFFLRLQFVAPVAERGDLEAALAEVAARHSMTIGLQPALERTRTLVLVSKAAHCLNTLLFQQSSGQLPIDVVGVAGNHDSLRPLAEFHGHDFHHIPITPETRAVAEAALVELVDELDVELIVLARYMQVLSPDLCARFAGRMINIHHSFLPSFKGAKPYHQAHARGVKLIGATAHYVTPDLDEGPIIEQDVARVDHNRSVADFVQRGQDVEAAVLARAVRWHAEGRILMDGHRTVVFT